MAALLSSRAVLMARSTSLSKGGIAGVVLGVFFGLLLVFLCIFPFLKRARLRRRRRDAGLTTEEGMTDGPYSHGCLGASPFANTLRRLSHGAPARPAAVVPGAGSDGDSAEKPDQAVFVSHSPPHSGPTSPVSPQHGAVDDFERLHGKYLQDGRTSTGSPTTLGPQITRDSTVLGIPSKETTTAGELEEKKIPQQQSVSDSLTSPVSRHGTFGSHGITDEPESLAGQGGLSHQGSQASHRRKRSGSRHLSDSIRQLAHHVSTAMRHDSIDSSRGSFTARSPVERPDVLVHSQTAPPIMEADLIDTEAPGLAYDYYHPGPDDILPHGPAHSASYGPGLSIPDTFAEPSTLPGSFISPTSATSVTPVSAVSPAPGLPTQNTWVNPGFVKEEGGTQDERFAAPQDKRWPPKPLQRTGTLPLQAFASDLPSPPTPSTEQQSVDPREVMKPSTRNEMDFEVKQELVKLSTPSPPADDSARGMSAFLTQPTPDPTPEPEVAPQHDWQGEWEAQQSSNERELPSIAPDIAVDNTDSATNDCSAGYDDTAMTDAGQWEQEQEQWQSPVPPAGTPGHLTSYGTPHSMTTPESHPPTQLTTPYLGAHSPQVIPGGSVQGNLGPMSDYTSSERASQSPGQYACHECDRVFDQLHKLHHHTRYHDRPHICQYRNCDQRFGTKTHLDRHVNDKHNNTKRFYCYYPDCSYGPQGKGFPRKDNWKRHMLNKHQMKNPGEPEAVNCQNEEMSGQ